MRNKRKNFNLFFYGLVAVLVQFVGVAVMVVSFGVVGSAGIGLTELSGWWGAVGLVIGIALLIYGKAQRFYYQRESGHIIHGGDSWR